MTGILVSVYEFFLNPASMSGLGVVLVVAAVVLIRYYTDSSLPDPMRMLERYSFWNRAGGGTAPRTPAAADVVPSEVMKPSSLAWPLTILAVIFAVAGGMLCFAAYKNGASLVRPPQPKDDAPKSVAYASDLKERQLKATYYPNADWLVVEAYWPDTVTQVQVKRRSGATPSYSVPVIVSPGDVIAVRWIRETPKVLEVGTWVIPTRA